VEFRREEGEGGASQRWIDHNLPTCPFCKTQSLWETGKETEQLALNIWVFRCPNCGAVLSTIPATSVSAVAEPVTIVKTAVTRNLRVETVERSEDKDFVGEEFPLAELQEWASDDES
jgi:hypothetical protein